jgi:hypothetical protein
MFETLTEEALLSLQKIDDSAAFNELLDNRAEMLECLNSAVLECRVQYAGSQDNNWNMQQVTKGLVCAQNIVNSVFNSCKDGETKQ